jgi:hypothetical protein
MQNINRVALRESQFFLGAWGKVMVAATFRSTTAGDSGIGRRLTTGEETVLYFGESSCSEYAEGTTVVDEETGDATTNSQRCSRACSAL